MFIRMIAVILISFQSFASEITNDQAIILEAFFKHLFEKSEAGYVMLGNKPLCMTGFRTIDDFSYETYSHEATVILKEAAGIWKNLNTKKSDFIVHIYNEPDPVSKYIHVLVINRPLFLKTIEENIVLFQYVLGPEITPQKLLEQLLKPEEIFYSVMKDDKVLIGIILGFNPQNSVYGSRIENLQESLFAAENPPFRSQLMKCSWSQEMMLNLALRKNSYDPNRKILKPSFGYPSVDEELLGLNNKMEISSFKLKNKDPNFIFGRLKNDPVSDQLVKELEICQDKIRKLLSEDNFLENVLVQIDSSLQTLYKKKLPPQLALEKKQKEKLAYLVAATMWDDINDQNEIYQNSFVSGCEAFNKGLKCDLEKSETFNYLRLCGFKKITENLCSTDLFFEKLHADTSFKCIEPKKLYYRIEQNCDGQSLNNQSIITARYVFKTHKNEILSDTFSSQPVKIDLIDTIPGFTKGIKGMNVGEIRELYIHPSLAYGLLTTSEKGHYLHVKVQLVSIEENSPKILDTATSATLALPVVCEADYIEESKNNGLGRGYKAWKHYSKTDQYTLSEVFKHLDRFRAGEKYDISDIESQNIINRLHWNLYNMTSTQK